MRKALRFVLTAITVCSLCGCSMERGVVDIKYDNVFNTENSIEDSHSAEYKGEKNIAIPLYNSIDEIETDWQLKPYDFNRSYQDNVYMDRYRGTDRELLDNDSVLMDCKDFTIMLDNIDYTGKAANIKYTILNNCPLDIKLKVNMVVNGVSTGLREYEVSSLGYTQANAFVSDEYMDWSEETLVESIKLGEVFVEYTPNTEYTDADRYTMLKNSGYRVGEPKESVEVSEGMEKIYSDSTCDIWYKAQLDGSQEKGIWVLIQNKSKLHSVSVSAVYFGDYKTIENRLEANTESITYGFIGLRGEQYEMLNEIGGKVKATFKVYYTNNPELGEVRFTKEIDLTI